MEETLHHLGCIRPRDKLPTSTGELRISEPLTVNGMKGLPWFTQSQVQIPKYTFQVLCHD